MKLSDISSPQALRSMSPEELQALGVSCPRVMTLSRILSGKTGEEQPVCVNMDEAETMVRRLIR